MSASTAIAPVTHTGHEARDAGIAFVLLLAFIIIAPFVAYPFFIMQMEGGSQAVDQAMDASGCPDQERNALDTYRLTEG